MVNYFGTKILVENDASGNVIDARLENHNIRPTPENPMQSATASINGVTFIVHLDQFGTIRGASAPPRITITTQLNKNCFSSNTIDLTFVEGHGILLRFLPYQHYFFYPPISTFLDSYLTKILLPLMLTFFVLAAFIISLATSICFDFSNWPFSFYPLCPSHSLLNVSLCHAS